MARRGTRGRADAGDAAAPDPRLRALHAIPPAKFTAARDALARALAAEGSPQAALVARLRRPPRATWLVNAVAQERPEIATALLEAGDRLRQAQSASLGGDVTDLRAASAALHAAVDAALVAARQLAAAEGRAPSAELLGEVTRGFRAAATAERDVREAFRQGMLQLPPEAGGDELLTALAAGRPDLPPARPLPRARPIAATSTARPAPAPRPSEVAQGREAAALRRRAERAAATEAAARERQRRRALAEAKRLEGARRAADARLARAEAAVAEAERRLAKARRAAEDARAARARLERH